MARRLNLSDVHLYPFSAPDKLRPVVVSAVALSIEDGMKGGCAVSLHNVQTVSQDRFGKWVTRLSDERMREVCAALRFAMGC